VFSSTTTVEPGESGAPSLPSAPAPVKPGAVSFGQPGVVKPNDHMIPRRTGDDISKSPFANWKPVNNPFSRVPHHLEAYIIQPMVKTCDFTLTLTYAVLPLPLSEQDMQAQIQKLGPDHSIVDSLIDLHPQVLKLMQSQAAQRHGDLVSIQHGKPSNFTVSSGTLQSSPVIFIISTTPKTLPQPSSLTTPASVQETLGQQPLSQGLFANPKLSPFGFKWDPFGTNAKVSETKLGVFEKAAPVPASAHHLASPEAYSRFLSEHRDETCTHVERDGQRLEHYQTITVNKDRLKKDCSLEEIRLSDYNAGRRFFPAGTTNPPLGNNGWDTWRTSFGPTNTPVALDGRRPAVPLNNTAGPHFGTSIFSPSGPSTVDADKSKLGIFGGGSVQTPSSPFQAFASAPKIDWFSTGPNTRSLLNASTPPMNNGTGSGQTSAVASGSARLPSLFGEPSKNATLFPKPATGGLFGGLFSTNTLPPITSGGLFSTNTLHPITSASKQPTFGFGGHTPAAQPASSQPSAAFSFKPAEGSLFASAFSGTTPASAPAAQPASSQPAVASSLKPGEEPLFTSSLPSTRPASDLPTFSLGGTTSAAQPAASQPAAQPVPSFTSAGPVKSATSTATPTPLPSGEAAAASGSANSHSGPSSFDGTKALHDFRKSLEEQTKKAP
jgi:hypothetical protein